MFQKIKPNSMHNMHNIIFQEFISLIKSKFQAIYLKILDGVKYKEVVKEFAQSYDIFFIIKTKFFLFVLEQSWSFFK